MTGARTGIHEVMLGIEAIDADPIAKAKFRQLVRTVAMQHGCAWVEKEERIAFARDLLSAKVSRPTIRDRLIATFDVSRPQAYRIIGSAMQLYQEMARN